MGSSRSGFVCAALAPRAPRRAACVKYELEEKSLFVFGLGYTGLALGCFLQNKGWRIYGTCSSREKADSLRERDWCAFQWTAGCPLDAAIVETAQLCSHVISSIPPLEGMDPILSVRQEMFHLAERTEWVGYISSTSVYSETEGGWVDEGSPTQKNMPRCKAENLWLELGDLEKTRSRVFRCAGIYGPNRNALATLRDRKAGNINDSKLVSRIHVGDLCRGIHASMTSSIAARKRVYNMADDLPASREEVFSYAKRLGSFSEGDTDLSTRTRRDKSRSSKRVNNARLRNELITDLVYPSYVEGLKDLENQCIWPFTESILQLSVNRTS